MVQYCSQWQKKGAVRRWWKKRLDCFAQVEPLAPGSRPLQHSYSQLPLIRHFPLTVTSSDLLLSRKAVVEEKKQQMCRSLRGKKGMRRVPEKD